MLFYIFLFFSHIFSVISSKLSKARPPPFKTQRELNLCPWIADQAVDEPEKKCDNKRCIFLHDRIEYLKIKPDDISDECHLFELSGRCLWGTTCRMGSKHLTKDGLNIIDKEKEKEFIIQIPKHEMFVISTKNELHTGLYNLSFEFNGALQPDKIVGFYSSKYKDAKNKIRYIATSKFEPTYARRAFPCFDEPAFKAEFTVRLVHPSGDYYSALSNMNAECTQINQPLPGLTTITFAKSVPMSTYLSCFIVSDFVALTKMAKGQNDRQFPVSVYTTKAQEEKGAFALDIGVKIIEYYINLFRIDYPLPKLDMAAIPDFVSGAMENWGLVTYREARLLYDNKTNSTLKAYDIVNVISHEFAHMWFGNLVTMSWWNDLWLNEGFASFMSYVSADAILPDWGMMDLFLIEQMHSVFVTDAKLSSHPIVQTVNNPDEITAIFDEISYKKGSSIIRMMENFIKPEVFYGAISTYLNKFIYANAETADLLRFWKNLHRIT